jgi:hypothetical protein
MPVFLTGKQWGRAKVRLPRNVLIAKRKKGTKVVRAGKAALAGLDGDGVLKRASKQEKTE